MSVELEHKFGEGAQKFGRKIPKRVYAGYYIRWDKKRICVARVVKDIDTGEEIAICKDASFSKKDNEGYYTITKASFREQVEILR